MKTYGRMDGHHPVPIYRAGAASGTTTTTSTTVVVTVPSTAKVGDVAVANLCVGGNRTMTTPAAGWTLRQGPDVNVVNNLCGAVYSKTLVAADINATATWIWSGTSEQTGLIDVFGNVIERQCVFGAVVQGSASTTTSANPTITVVSNGFILSSWVGFINSATTFTTTKPSGYTVGQTWATSNASNNRAATTGFKAGSGTLGGDNATYSSTTARQMSYSVAIAPM